MNYESCTMNSKESCDGTWHLRASVVMQIPESNQGAVPGAVRCNKEMDCSD